MVDLRIEVLDRSNIPEMDHLFQSYYIPTNAHKDLPPYDFDWSIYTGAQAAGKLLVVTAREDGALLGFAMYFVMEHPHHKGFLVAECDGIQVDMHHRGKGIGSLLLSYCEDCLRGLEVKRMSNRFRHVYDTTPLFEKHGFKPAETTFIKDL